MADEPGGLRQARGKGKVLAGDGAAELAGDGDEVAGFAAGAEDEVFAFDAAFASDGDEGPGGEAGGFAAGENAAVLGEAFADAAVEAIHPDDGAVGIDGDGDEEVVGFTAHGGEVAEDAGDGFPADFFGRGVGEEVHTFDDGVG